MLFGKKENFFEKRERELESAARKNEMLCLYGHKGCDAADAVWVLEDGRLARFTVGAVKKKRIELGLDENVVEM